MFSQFHTEYTYKEFDRLSKSNQPLYKEEKLIKALRISGRTTVTHKEDGDEVYCNIAYRSDNYLRPKSLLDGYEIIECVKINALGLNTGYISYVK